MIYMRSQRLFTLAVAGLGALACSPDLGAPPSLVDGPRVLAVRGEPPEVRPGEPASFEALVVDEEGRVTAAFDWTFCLTPKPPIENNIVTAACLADGGAPIATAAAGLVPMDACKRFGPDPPGPGLRGRDPDVTGGFFVPVRVEALGQVAFGLQRIRCNLAQAPLGVAQDFSERYAPNQNPSIGALELPENVASGASLDLTVEAMGQEAYVRFDPASRTLVDDVEALTVSWFATGGRFLEDRSAVADARATNRWTAPEAGGPVRFFAVLRDSRGGAAFVEGGVEVR